MSWAKFSSHFFNKKNKLNQLFTKVFLLPRIPKELEGELVEGGGEGQKGIAEYLR